MSSPFSEEEKSSGCCGSRRPGAKTEEVCRRHGISDATFLWTALPWQEGSGPGLTVIEQQFSS